MTPFSRATWQILSLCIPLAIFTIPAMAQPSDEKAIIVFDASGSMWGQIGGKSKIEIARDTLDRVVGNLPQNLQLGMIAYGHNRKGDCRDIETMVHVGPSSITGQQIARSVRQIRPKGKTPLSDAVRMAANQLRYTEDKATVILVTDGIETCNANPCALASQLEQSGIDFTTHVVGFGLSAEEGRQVACLAENTGGLYLQADNAQELAHALGRTVATAPIAPEPAPEQRQRPPHNFIGHISLTEGGEPLPHEATTGLAWYIQRLDDEGETGPRKNISRTNKVKWSGPTGRHLITITYGLGGKSAHTISMDEFATIKQTLALNAARLQGIGAFMRDDFGIHKSALIWTIKNKDNGQKIQRHGYATDLIIPAGSYEISYKLRGDKTTLSPPQTIELAAGETKQVNFILPYSQVAITALETNNKRNTAIRQRISKRLEDGSAGEMIKYESSAKPVFLHPGAYIVAIEIWDGTKRQPVTMPIDVGLGEKHSFTIRLP